MTIQTAQFDENGQLLVLNFQSISQIKCKYCKRAQNRRDGQKGPSIFNILETLEKYKNNLT